MLWSFPWSLLQFPSCRTFSIPHMQYRDIRNWLDSAHHFYNRKYTRPWTVSQLFKRQYIPFFPASIMRIRIWFVNFFVHYQYCLWLIVSVFFRVAGYTSWFVRYRVMTLRAPAYNTVVVSPSNPLTISYKYVILLAAKLLLQQDPLIEYDNACRRNRKVDAERCLLRWSWNH